MRAGSAAIVWAAAAACVAVALAIAARDLDEPGLYYDEVIQAGPALAFLRGEDVPLRVPGARSVRVGGAWLPWMTQPYMGALKSQLLIPAFAAAPAKAETLRLTTLLWALLGIPFAMAFANRALGLGVALTAGALLAVDPSLLFIARHDWGSFSLAFVARCAALCLGGVALRRRSVWAAAAAGLCLGLGLYNKIDLGVFVAAAGLSLLLAAGEPVAQAVRARRHELAAWIGGLALGALPLLVALGGAFSVAGAASRGRSLAAEWPEKWWTLQSVLDGSYFLRLMQSGGRFEDLGTAPAAGPALGLVAFVAAVLIIACLQAVPRARGPQDRAVRFVALTALLTLAGIALVPGAVRAHHFLNAWPFPQLVVASAGVLLWTRAGAIAPALRWPGRALGTLLVAAMLLSSLRLDAATLDAVSGSGGRGRWSHAVERWLEAVPPGRRLVSLDWGFDEQIRFLAPERSTDEPIWRLRRGGGAARIEGGPDDVYLAHEPRYAVMPYGDALLVALETLPPDAYETSLQRDRSGEPVFRAIRFHRPHELVYRGGRFQVRLR